MTTYAQQERRALVESMREAGPDAPTLCAGWAVRDLAAHLVVRERRPDAGIGLVVPSLRPYTERVLRSVRDARPWPELLGRVASGPPVLLRLADEQMNTIEFFVHHEDVRRAAPTWEPRAIGDDQERALWKRLRFFSRMVRGRVPGGLTLEAPGFGTLVVRPGDPHVTLTGAPSELLLFVFGRQGAAKVDASGPEDAITRLREAKLGI